jgi:MFS family permease
MITRDEAARRLVALGYITAVAMPPVGLIMGAVVGLRLSRAYSRHWVWIVALSVLAGVVWVLLLSSNILDTNTNDLT